MLMENCPRFERCSVNNCPLHPKYPDMDTCPQDSEKRCTLGKKKRLLIASDSGLKFKGMTTREWGSQGKDTSHLRSFQNGSNFAKKDDFIG